MKQIIKSGDEHDCIVQNKSLFNWRSGIRKRIKRALNKRHRKESQRAIQNSR